MHDTVRRYLIRLSVAGEVYAGDLVEALRVLARESGAQMLRAEVVELMNGEPRVVVSTEDEADERQRDV